MGSQPTDHAPRAGPAGPGGDPVRALSEHEALQLREAQLRGILDAASEGIVAVDASQTIVMANARAAAIFGYRVGQLVGAPLALLIPRRRRRWLARLLADFAAAESPPRRMAGQRGLSGLRADGQEFPIDAGISQAHVDGVRLTTLVLRDLSEQRSAAAALRTSEQLLAATFSVSNVGMAQLDPRTRRFAAVNEAFQALCGYGPQELLELDLDRLNHPAEPSCAELVDALLDGHPPWDVERRIVRKDGTVLWIHLSAGLALDDDGRPVRVVCVVQDITARREALAALRTRQARLEFLVQLNDRLRLCTDPQQIGHEAACLLGAFCGADRVGYAEDAGDGVHIDVARNYARGVPGIEGRYRYLDYGPALLGALRAGRTVVQPDIANDPTLPADVKAAHAALQLGATVNVPLLRDGALIAVLFVHHRQAHAWAPEEVALFEDVAARVRADIERARAEAVLRATKAKLEAAMASLRDALFISDSEGVITDFNDAFVRFHRFRDRAECPRLLDEYPAVIDVTRLDGAPVPPDQWPIPRALRGETDTNLEFALRHRHTGERWIGSYSFAPIRDAGGRVVGTVCSARDITEQRLVRTQLEASQAGLRRLIAAQDRVQDEERLRIARELHDDLQQNLAAILMEAEVVRSASAGVDGQVREALDRIARLGGEVIASMRRIVHDLRPQALEELGLVPALHTLAAGFSQRHGIPCRVEVAARGADTPGPQSPVATCLYRVAQEALNNVARHAGARQARLHLAGAAGHRIVLTVSDDGAGIRASELHKPESYGLLGMRERVRAAGGTLSVRAGTPAGTVVEVSLPLRGEPAPQRG